MTVNKLFLYGHACHHDHILRDEQKNVTLNHTSNSVLLIIAKCYFAFGQTNVILKFNLCINFMTLTVFKRYTLIVSRFYVFTYLLDCYISYFIVCLLVSIISYYIIAYKIKHRLECRSVVYVSTWHNILHQYTSKHTVKNEY